MVKEHYQAILFDFDMTLADSVGVITTLLNQTAEHFGYPTRSLSEMLSIAGKGYTHEKMLYLTTGETDSERILAMRTWYRKISQEQMPRLTKFFPGVPEMLRNLSQVGLKMAVVSQKMGGTLMACLKQGGLASYFQTVLGCEDVPVPKPDPSGLLLAASRLQVLPDRCLYIGDSLIDQQAARAAGMDFAAMLQGGTARERFDPAAVRWYFDSAVQIARMFVNGLLQK